MVNKKMLEKLLLNRETMSRGENVSTLDPDEPFTPEEREKNKREPI